MAKKKCLEDRVKNAGGAFIDLARVISHPYSDDKENIKLLCQKKNEKAINLLHEAYLFIKKMPLIELEKYWNAGLRLPSHKKMNLLKDDVQAIGDLILAYKIRDNENIDGDKLNIKYGVAISIDFLKDYRSILTYLKDSKEANKN